jgi:hypothetical protein
MGGLALVVASAALVGVFTIGQQASSVRWDPGVADIAHFVEQQRGHRFHRAVTVAVLPTGAFRAAIGAGRPPAGRPPAGGPPGAELQQTIAWLRATGVITGPVDEAAAATQLSSDSVIGLYLPASRKIVVEGTALTPDVRVTLAHELTHALQDQDGDLAAIRHAHGVPGPVARAVIEGDAVAVEQDYARTLSPSDLAEYRAARVAQMAAAAAGPSGQLPIGLRNSLSFPYVFGPAFIDAVRGASGTARVDRAFRQPPTTEAEIVDPGRYLAGWRPTSVDAPQPPSGASLIGPTGPLGQVTLFQVLGTRLGYRDAWSAVRGWNGDRAVAFHLGERSCLAVAVGMASSLDTQRLERVAKQWASPTGAIVTRRGLAISLQVCEPGPAPSVNPPPWQVLSLRAGLVAVYLTQHHASAPAAACAADRLIADMGPTDLIGYDQPTASADMTARVTTANAAALGACGIGSR